MHGLTNLKVNYRVVPVVSQTNPIHAPPSYFFKNHFNIIHLHPYIPSCLFHLGFPIKTPYAFLFPHTCHMPCQSRHLDLISLIQFNEEHSWRHCLLYTGYWVFPICRGADHPPRLAPRWRMGWNYNVASPLCMHGHVMGWPLPLQLMKLLTVHFSPVSLLKISLLVVSN